MSFTTAHQKVAEAARAAGTKYVSPFRLGIWCVKTGCLLPSPYSSIRATRSFQDGIREGQRRAAIAAQGGKDA